MVREVLTISVGQGGVQLGDSIWKQYCAEHNIESTGKREADAPEDLYFGSFFEECGSGQFVPRNLSVDLEPTVINDVRRGSHGGMYNPNFLVHGVEDAANNFARGMYTVGKEILDLVMDRIRKLAENSENSQGFLINHAVGGGTGSGLGMLIMERLNLEFRKKTKIGFEIYPAPRQATAVVEPYNGLLSTHWLTDHSDLSIVLDNEALYNICQRKLNIKHPTYSTINNVVAKAASSVTASLRFDGELNTDLDEFLTNLVPFPRLHFMTTGLAPIRNSENSSESQTCRYITDECLNSQNFLVSYPDFDVESDKYMAISLNYRGMCHAKEVNAAVDWIKSNPTTKASFVDWSPTGWKIGLNDVPAATTEEDVMCGCNRNCVMIGNNVAISNIFEERLCQKFDMMYSQRAYVHWYVGEGMEEGEFAEAREDLDFLQKDYQSVVSEQSEEDYSISSVEEVF